MAFSPSVTVGGAIIPGVCDFPAEPTYSVLTLVPTTGVAVGVPDGARYLDVELYNDTTTLIYGAGAPVLWVGGGNYAVPQLVKDYTTGVCMPPHPVPIAGSPGKIGDPTLTVTLDTNVECRAIAQFFLEF